MGRRHKMITSDDLPALGGVYKLSAIVRNGVVYPRIKNIENPVKMTNPGIKMFTVSMKTRRAKQ